MGGLRELNEVTCEALGMGPAHSKGHVLAIVIISWCWDRQERSEYKPQERQAGSQWTQSDL